MKIQRNGQAAVLDDERFEELMGELSASDRLLFSICYYTSCRISEALQLRREDIVGDRILFRRATTKNKRTRNVKICIKLGWLINSMGLPKSGYLFPGKDGKPKTRQAADRALRKACDYIGLTGVSTHSFRRSSLTKLYRAGVPLTILQKRSGHASPANLALYIDVDREEVDAAGELL